MTARDPIKKITLADGRTRYRFTIDVGKRPDGKRDQRKFTFDSLKQARAERARIITETATGSYVRPNRKLTVAEFLTEWIEGREVKPTTLRFYQDALRPVIDAYGTMPLQNLDVGHLDKLKRAMQSGQARRRGTAGKPLSARSVNAMLSATATALKAAVKRGLVSRNVAELVDRVRDDRHDDEISDRGAWQASDAVAFLRSVRDDRLYAGWLLSLLGLRRGEVLGMRWADVDPTGGQARTRKLPEGTPSIAIVNTRLSVAGAIHEGTPKGRGRRKVSALPIPAPVVAALEALQLLQLAEQDAAGDAYRTCPECGGAHVVADEAGQPYRPEWYADRFTTLAERAGLPRIPLHGARHCAASLLADLGIPDVAVAAWLGHTQVTVTHNYQHVMAQRLAEASQALGDALTGPAQP